MSAPNPFGELASQAGSRRGDDSVRGRTNDHKHYNEDRRLKDLFQLYSTLEEKPMSQDIQDEDREAADETMSMHKEMQSN